MFKCFLYYNFLEYLVKHILIILNIVALDNFKSVGLPGLEAFDLVDVCSKSIAEALVD